MLAAVGPMQFEVAVHRLENEFGAPVELTPRPVHGGPPHRRASRPTPLRAMTRRPDRSHRADGTLLAVFESPYWLDRVEQEQPDLRLERLVAEGAEG